MAEPETTVTTSSDRKRESDRALAALMAAIYIWHPQLEEWHAGLGRKVRPAIIQPQEFSAFTMKRLMDLPGYTVLRDFAVGILSRYAPESVTGGGTVMVLEMV